MRYRTKLYLSLMGMAFFSTALALGIVYFETKAFFFREFQSKVKSIAVTTAVALDPNLVKQVQTRQDESSAAYKELQTVLRKARDGNRRENVYIKYLYTLMPSPNNPNMMVFGVDAEEDPKYVSHVGDVDPDIPYTNLLHHLKQPYSADRFEPDSWGVWLTGYAPVLDQEGNYIATVGADINAQDIVHEFNTLLLFGCYALIASLGVGALGATFLSRSATKSLGILCNSVKEVGHGNLDVITHLKTHDEFGELATAINQMVRGLKEREKLKSSFSRYVSSYVLEKILDSETPLKLEGERRKVTVLFCDIRRFTTLAEKLPPEEVVSILNQYFDQMLDAIFSNLGTLDNFIGDGMMVEFGVPLDDPKQELNAVLCAIEMQKKLKKLCEKWVRQGKPSIEIGIGVHTGLAVVGNIGSEERMQYTAIGDTVNVAARLEQASKTMGEAIIISETTYKALKGEFKVKELGPLALPGRTSEINAFAILPF